MLRPVLTLKFRSPLLAFGNFVCCWPHRFARFRYIGIQFIVFATDAVNMCIFANNKGTKYNWEQGIRKTRQSYLRQILVREFQEPNGIVHRDVYRISVFKDIKAIVFVLEVAGYALDLHRFVCGVGNHDMRDICACRHEGIMCTINTAVNKTR